MAAAAGVVPAFSAGCFNDAQGAAAANGALFSTAAARKGNRISIVACANHWVVRRLDAVGHLARKE